MESLLDSHSALSRFKAQMGLKPTSINTGSSYIMVSKIKKILKHDITKESFDVLKLRFFSKNTEITKDVFVDRLVSKIDGFTNPMLRYVMAVHENEGIDALVVAIRQPLVKIKKSAELHFADEKKWDAEDDANGTPVIIDESLFRSHDA